MSNHYTISSSFEFTLLTELDKFNFVQDRLPGDVLTLPYSYYDVKLKPNDFIISETINNSLNMLYQNWLYLISSSVIPSNSIPNRDYFNKMIADESTTYIVKQGTAAPANGRVPQPKWIDAPSTIDEFKTLTQGDRYFGRIWSGVKEMTKIQNIADPNNYNIIATTDTNVIMLSGTDTTAIDVIGNFNDVKNPIYSNNNITHPSNEVLFRDIKGHVVTDDNELYILDGFHKTIFKFDINGMLSLDTAILLNDTPGRLMTGMIGGPGEINDKTRFVEPLVIETVNNLIYIIDYKADASAIKVFDSDLNWRGTFNVGSVLNDGPISMKFNDETNRFYVLSHQRTFFRDRLSELTQEQSFSPAKLVVFDSSFNHIESRDLNDTSYSANINVETYKRIYFSIENKNIFYVLTNKSLYKKYVSRPERFIGEFLLEEKQIGGGDKSQTFTDMIVYESSVTEGEDVIQKDEILLLDSFYEIIYQFFEDSNYERSLQSEFDDKTMFFDSLKVDSEEYVSTITYNKLFTKHLYNNLLLIENTYRKFTTKFNRSGIPQYIGFRYLNENQLNEVEYNISLDHYLGTNEIATNVAFNRCLEQLLKIQLNALDKMQERVLNVYPLITDVIPLTSPFEDQIVATGLDTDGDTIPDAIDTDDDDDGLTDIREQQLGTDPLLADTDGDGLTDLEEIETTGTLPLDPDSDDDTVRDGSDAFPLNPNESRDTDGDGIGDNADTDDDNDGVSDTQENINQAAYVAAGNEEPDIDFKDDPDRSTGVDTDGDGIDDGLDVDDDNDTYLDNNYTSTPNLNERLDELNKSQYLVDTDGDGEPDSYQVEASSAYDSDPDRATGVDTDSDGVDDVFDDDDDNDGLKDVDELAGTSIVFPGDEEPTVLTSDPLSQDTDGDGLTDYEEIGDGGTGTDPRNVDTDGDGVNDNVDPFPDDGTATTDTDSDGLPDQLTDVSPTGLIEDTDDDNDGMSDIDEQNYVSNSTGDSPDPLDADSDNDGLTDGEEIAAGADPTTSDTDGDGLGDYDEVRNLLLNPASSDTDGDGLSDYDEINTHNTNPSNDDSDGDGLLDGDELNVYNTNPNITDTDSDGLTDGQEILQFSTDPTDQDSDDDSLLDSSEISAGTDPNDSDSDDDGLTDYRELQGDVNTDPLVKDSDGDGLLDGQEVDGFTATNNVTYQTDPNKTDTDNDGLTDTYELTGTDGDFVSDPTDTDTDDDFINDFDDTTPTSPNLVLVEPLPANYSFINQVLTYTHPQSVDENNPTSIALGVTFESLYVNPDYIKTITSPHAGSDQNLSFEVITESSGERKLYMKSNRDYEEGISYPATVTITTQDDDTETIDFFVVLNDVNLAFVTTDNKLTNNNGVYSYDTTHINDTGRSGVVEDSAENESGKDIVTLTALVTPVGEMRSTNTYVITNDTHFEIVDDVLRLKSRDSIDYETGLDISGGSKFATCTVSIYDKNNTSLDFNVTVEILDSLDEDTDGDGLKDDIDDTKFDQQLQFVSDIQIPYLDVTDLNNADVVYLNQYDLEQAVNENDDSTYDIIELDDLFINSDWLSTTNAFSFYDETTQQTSPTHDRFTIITNNGKRTLVLKSNQNYDTLTVSANGNRYATCIIRAIGKETSPVPKFINVAVRIDNIDLEFASDQNLNITGTTASMTYSANVVENNDEVMIVDLDDLFINKEELVSYSLDVNNNFTLNGTEIKLSANRDFETTGSSVACTARALDQNGTELSVDITVNIVNDADEDQDTLLEPNDDTPLTAQLQFVDDSSLNWLTLIDTNNAEIIGDSGLMQSVPENNATAVQIIDIKTLFENDEFISDDQPYEITTGEDRFAIVGDILYLTPGQDYDSLPDSNGKRYAVCEFNVKGKEPNNTYTKYIALSATITDVELAFDQYNTSLAIQDIYHANYSYTVPITENNDKQVIVDLDSLFINKEEYAELLSRFELDNTTDFELSGSELFLKEGRDYEVTGATTTCHVTAYSVSDVGYEIDFLVNIVNDPDEDLDLILEPDDQTPETAGLQFADVSQLNWVNINNDQADIKYVDASNNELSVQENNTSEIDLGIINVLFDNPDYIDENVPFYVGSSYDQLATSDFFGFRYDEVNETWTLYLRSGIDYESVPPVSASGDSLSDKTATYTFNVKGQQSDRSNDKTISVNVKITGTTNEDTDGDGIFDNVPDATKYEPRLQLKSNGVLGFTAVVNENTAATIGNTSTFQNQIINSSFIERFEIVNDTGNNFSVDNTTGDIDMIPQNYEQNTTINAEVLAVGKQDNREHDILFTISVTILNQQLQFNTNVNELSNVIGDTAIYTYSASVDENNIDTLIVDLNDLFVNTTELSGIGYTLDITDDFTIINNMLYLNANRDHETTGDTITCIVSAYDQDASRLSVEFVVNIDDVPDTIPELGADTDKITIVSTEQDTQVFQVSAVTDLDEGVDWAVSNYPELFNVNVDGWVEYNGTAIDSQILDNDDTFDLTITGGGKVSNIEETVTIPVSVVFE